jgi:hypothetical protein
VASKVKPSEASGGFRGVKADEGVMDAIMTERPGLERRNFRQP